MGADLMEILRKLEENANLIGEHIAYIEQENSMTWSEVQALSDCLAFGLDGLGVGKRTRVGLCGQNSIDWILCLFGLLKCGAIPVLINPDHTVEEKQNLVQKHDVQCVLIGTARSRSLEKDFEGWIPFHKMKNLREMAVERRLTQVDYNNLSSLTSQVDDNSLGMILFTSGTTSDPKGVKLTYKQLYKNGEALAQACRWTHNDRQILTLPMHHCSGLTAGILMALSVGASSVILSRFHPIEAMKMIEKHRCTAMNAVPSMFLMMCECDKKYDLSTLCSGTLAGSTIGETEYLKITQFTGMQHLLPCYGQTETSPIVTIVGYEDTIEQRSKSIGKPLPGVELRTFMCPEQRLAKPYEIGEIEVRSPYTMLGYDGQEDETNLKIDPQGWLKTGDLGYVDTDGYLYFTGRCRDIIVRGGENVVPFEIEEQIRKLESSIIDLKVIGVPDPMMQEVPMAMIVSTKTVDIPWLKQELSKHLSKFKVPEYIYQIPKLPRTTTGKIDVQAARKLAEDLLNQMEQ